MALSLAAALATMTEMRRKGVIRYVWEQGQKLKEGYILLARQFGVEHPLHRPATAHGDHFQGEWRGVSIG